jgi:hypothetical protein
MYNPSSAVLNTLGRLSKDQDPLVERNRLDSMRTFETCAATQPFFKDFCIDRRKLNTTKDHAA